MAGREVLRMYSARVSDLNICPVLHITQQNDKFCQKFLIAGHHERGNRCSPISESEFQEITF